MLLFSELRQGLLRLAITGADLVSATLFFQTLKDRLCVCVWGGKGSTPLYNTNIKCMSDLCTSPQILMTPRSRSVATFSFRHDSYFCSRFSLIAHHSDHSRLEKQPQGLPGILGARLLGPRVGSTVLRSCPVFKEIFPSQLGEGTSQ